MQHLVTKLSLVRHSGQVRVIYNPCYSKITNQPTNQPTQHIKLCKLFVFRIITRVVQKVLSLIQGDSEKLDSFSLFFNIVSLDINAFGSTMLNLSTKEGGIRVLQKFLHNAFDLIIVSKMKTMQVGFEFRK